MKILNLTNSKASDIKFEVSNFPDGIFSKGFDELFKYFDGIYCTNSYSEIDSESRNINLKQLNVF